MMEHASRIVGRIVNNEYNAAFQVLVDIGRALQ